MGRLDRRDLACFPWWLWILGLTLGYAGRSPEAIDGAVPLILIAVAAAPGFLLVWIARRSWFVRRGWWIPLLLIAAGAVLFPADS